MPKETPQSPETITGENFIAFIEQRMGKTGLQVLAALTKEFIFTEMAEPDQEAILTRLRLQTFQKERLTGNAIYFRYKSRQGKVEVLFSSSSDKKFRSSWWVAEKHIPQESGKEDLWKIEINYSIGPDPDREIQFFGGLNKFTSGETGITATTGTWLKMQTIDTETRQAIIVFNVFKNDRFFCAVTLPTSSLLLPQDKKTEKIISDQLLPQVEK